MGLTLWKHSANGTILKTDVVVVKDYLTKEKLESLERIVSAFLDLAEGRDILKEADRISHEIACDKAISKFKKCRVNYINQILIY